MNTINIILYFVGAVLIGAVIGILTLKIYLSLESSKLKRNAKKFSEGNMKNKYKYEGKTVDVNKFKVRTDDGIEKTIDCKKSN